MTRGTLWLVFGGAVAAAVVYVAAPVLAARELVAAAEAGDAAGLERRVDFPAFRESLKDELNARLMREMRDSDDRAGRALAMLFGPALVSGVVDAFVTPEAIAVMVREAEPPSPDLEGSPAAPSPDAGADPDQVRQSYGFRDLNTFTVTLTREDRPETPVVLLMQRRGLIDWKLAGIDLPDTPDETPASESQAPPAAS
jgi:hypothetical protein